MSKPDKIEVPEWYCEGDMMYRRDYLDISHPEHTYNYIKNKLNLIPEEFGIFHPFTEKYKDYSREELLSVISNLENELNFRNQYMN